MTPASRLYRSLLSPVWYIQVQIAVIMTRPLPIITHLDNVLKASRAQGLLHWPGRAPRHPPTDSSSSSAVVVGPGQQRLLHIRGSVAADVTPTSLLCDVDRLRRLQRLKQSIQEHCARHGVQPWECSEPVLITCTFSCFLCTNHLCILLLPLL